MTLKSEAFGELRYPATRYAPAPIADQSVGTDQARLSRPALRAFLNVIRRWRLKDEVACQLLGGIPQSTLHAYMRDFDLLLDQDQLTRISHLIGILKALHVLHGRDVADRWVTLPNSNRIFGGRSPLDYLLKGGIPAMQIVHQLLDARGGQA
jgi:Protein of unknown function (DUF2384)